MNLDLIKEVLAKVTSGGDPKNIITELIASQGQDNVTEVISKLVGSDLLKNKDYLAEGISAEDLTANGLKVVEDIKSGNFSLDSVQDLVGGELQDKATDMLKDKLSGGLGGLLGK